MRAASEVGQAEEQLAAAVAAVERLRGQQVPTAAAAAAGDALAEARAALAAHLASSGAVLPRGEVLFIPRLPAVVAALGADVGEPAPTDGPLLTVFSGEAMVQATASTASARSCASACRPPCACPVATRSPAGSRPWGRNRS